MKALGCQTVESTSLSKFWFQIVNLHPYTKELFAQADTDRSGAVDQEEFARLLADLQSSYPQVRRHGIYFHPLVR